MAWKRRTPVGMMLTSLIMAALMVGCATSKDTVSQTEKGEKDRPGFAQTKAIAEEGFIYGLPIVMNFIFPYITGPNLM